MSLDAEYFINDNAAFRLFCSYGVMPNVKLQKTGNESQRIKIANLFEP